MIRHCLVLAALCWAVPAVAQTVIRPDPPLDSTRVVVRDALLVLRDSLNAIDAAAARLQRDFRHASGPSLLSRARVMHAACARSTRTIPSVRQAVLDAKISEPRSLEQRQELVGAMSHLGKALDRCKQEFAAMGQPGQAETVRGYGNDRAIRVQKAMRKYETALRSFFSVMGIKVMPLGAHPPPAAG
jgi:hypothetical protein